MVVRPGGILQLDRRACRLVVKDSLIWDGLNVILSSNRWQYADPLGQDKIRPSVKLADTKKLFEAIYSWLEGETERCCRPSCSSNIELDRSKSLRG